MRWSKCLFICLLACVLSFPVLASDKLNVPDPLEPWVGWVLHNHEVQVNGISRYNNSNQRICSWPSRLTLDVDDTGATFSQDWEVNCAGWIVLPGGEPHWPANVRINGAPATIVLREQGRPGIKVDIGRYKVTGRFQWNQVPENIMIPGNTALIDLTVKNQKIGYPQLDPTGKLWFQVEKQIEETIENRLTFQSYRLIHDSIPSEMTIYLWFDVAGTARQITIGPVFDRDKAIPMVITSDIPAKVDKNGQMIVQVRPGNWSVKLKVRLTDQLTELAFIQPNDGFWPAEEIWCYSAQSSLRIAEIENVLPIDPQQTLLPDNWRQYPAYIMHSGDTMRFKEIQRGNPDPAPDQLSMVRTAWLKFDGSGYTFQDEITGTKNSGWRLEMTDEIKLGKVEVNGEIQFITQQENSNKPGVELRMGSLNLVADSEYSASVSSLPLTGWNQSFESVSTNLHLPPGYRLIHAIGTDNNPRGWVATWDLLDLFFILLITAAVYRLFGFKEAILAFTTLGLLYPESGAPKWIWLAAIIGIALLKNLPDNMFRKLIRVYQIMVMAILVIVSVQFAVSHLRTSIFPQLRESGNRSINHYSARNIAEAPRESMDDFSGVDEERIQAAKTSLSSSRKTKSQMIQQMGYQSLNQVAQYDPSVKNQTGPGLPQWDWSTIYLTSGPTNPGQRLIVLLTGPKTNMALGFIRVALMFILGIVFAGITFSRGSGWNYKGITSLVVTVLIACCLLNPAITQAGDIPPNDMLEQLKNRLLEQDDCFPNCSTLLDLSMEVTENNFNLELEFCSEIDAAVPLPGNAMHWIPETISHNGKPIKRLLRSNDQLWIHLSPGRHKIELFGKMAPFNTSQLLLPMKPFSIDVQVSGWSVEGIRDDGSIENQLQFRRLETTENTNETKLETGIMPPFVTVERSLLLGLEWRIVTTVQRKTPLDEAIVLQFPLLENESILTAGIEVNNGVARVNLDGAAREIQWESMLVPSEEIILTHSDTDQWNEIWQVDVSPIFHMESDGIPVILEKQGERWYPRWHPWPGEKVVLTVTRPTGVDGQTLTILSSELLVRPGKHATECTLSFTIQSSQGMQHNITLPEDIQIKTIEIDHRMQPIRIEGRSVPLLVRPGVQQVKIQWRQNTGTAIISKTPEIDLGVRSVNATIKVMYPGNRWVFWLFGPRMGPAVLFWSVLIVIFIGSFILGKTGMTPLKMHHWFFLALGMSQGHLAGMLIVLVWLLVLHFRAKIPSKFHPKLFDLIQVGIVILTGVALIALIASISMGLLGRPDMSIAGNGSYQNNFYWYQDCCEKLLPIAGVVSIHIFFYRIAMLLWALWTAFYLMRIMKWAWISFSQPVYWMKFFNRSIKKPNGWDK